MIKSPVTKLRIKWRRSTKSFKICASTLVFADALLLIQYFLLRLSLPNLTPLDDFELAERSITYPKGLAEDVFVKVGKFHFPTDFVVVDFEADPRVPLILGRSFLRTGRALIDVYGEEITLRVDNEAVTFNLDQTTRYSSTNDKSVNRIDIIDAVCEEYAPELLGFSNSSGGNPTPTSEPFTSEFILEEIEAYLKDDSISPEIDHADCDPEEDICLIEKLLNNDPFQLPPMDLKQSEVTEAKSSIEEPPELELKDLPSHLEYAYLEENDKLPVIIAKGLKDDEKDALLKVLKSHKRAIAWKITDIKGIDPRFCTHKILMEDDYKPTVQSQRRVNPKIYEVIKKEVLKLLDAGMIYPISDSPWVSPVHYVPNKGGITVVANEENELILTPEYRGLIAKLPHPTTVKGVRSFLGHAGFYRRFIQDFSKIARKMTHLLEKETAVVFSKDCINAFQTLKKKLTEAPILVVPDWNLPFELMCDASDFAIGSENLTADHLSRLENPHKDVLENKDINEHFPLETLGVISSEGLVWGCDSDRVLLFNSRLKIFSGKLKTRWSGPFTITKVFPYGTIELSQPDGPNFKVIGHRVKHYFGGDLPPKVRILQKSQENGQNRANTDTGTEEHTKSREFLQKGQEVNSRSNGQPLVNKSTL
ncbi:reverse transcriptase domain-containing protein [Tanacetum coccineum]